MKTWKPIQNYEGLYEVSSDGEIRSLHNRYGVNRVLKQSIGSKGYKVVSLCKNHTQKTFNVHRLVALAFIPNPDSLPCVNHKDEDKTNNCAENLEWCSYYSNNVYGNRLTKSAAKTSIPVKCLETGVVYASSRSAQRETKIQQSHISSCCNKNRKTAGGLHWEYA